ncbi:MAG TPA: bifunctional pyr operon transcriptional regulator/uracil phosphoribosyltransferase, partial [Alcanivorax sp.]|nr:bifunctional pyr operon transcriptional regulator/uracil phosphoribosyltransferase [Alcanivorax sp.]
TMAKAITEQYGDSSPLLVGIESGGAWVAQALNEKLAKPVPMGTLNPAFYRDDFDTRGLKSTVSPS